MDTGKGKFLYVVTIAFLITGNLVGAGILGLPVNTGIDGFMPSLLAMLVFGGAMFFTAVILGREAAATKQQSFNYPSLYQRYLGAGGKWVAILANMLILYGLLTAYLTGGTSIVVNLFNIKSSWGGPLILLGIFVLLTGLTVLGISVIRKYNTLLMVLLWASFAVIVILAEPSVKPIRLTTADWGFLPVAIPIIVTSFHFHNIIPNICGSLQWKMSNIWKAMLFGMIIGYIMNAVWIEVGVGSLPRSGGSDSLIYAFQHNIPATVPMAKVIHSKLFTTLSMLFALLAITTSYIANGLGLMGFNEDLLKNFFKRSSRPLLVAMTFLPPLVISYLFPNIFLKAINLVGGVGIVVLFGVLPSIIAFIKLKPKSLKVLSVVMAILFAAVLVFQICEECGLIHLTPKADHVEKNVNQAIADKAKK